MNESHVITIKLQFDDGAFVTHEIHEVFRGGETECQLLKGRISGCSVAQSRCGKTSCVVTNSRSSVVAPSPGTRSWRGRFFPAPGSAQSPLQVLS
jgi:hypothetical protein